MTFDTFISYASKDKTVADAVCARLESAGIRCWIAPRDIVPGTSYGEAIIDAIHGAKVMVLVFSANANFSAHIPKEVERAVSNGVAIIPFRIEDVAPGKSLDYFIGSVHWLDAMSPPMEKHLDDLATTVQKLLSVKSGQQVVSAAPATGVWRNSAPVAAPKPTTGAVVSGAKAPASFSKTMWIGVAAVALLAAIVTAVVLLRGGGNSPGSGPEVHQPVTPADSISAAGSVPPSPSPSVKANTKTGTDPIMGCYQWFNNVPVVIRADGTLVAGSFTARWRLVSAARHEYTFTWPKATDTVTITPDQRSLSGSNQYGFATSGVRLTGSTGLVGTWRWPNGVPVAMAADGSFSGGPFSGTWRTIDESRRIYSLVWPNPVDSVTFLPDHSRFSGANQFGVPVSGVRTTPCVKN